MEGKPENTQRFTEQRTRAEDSAWNLQSQGSGFEPGPLTNGTQQNQGLFRSQEDIKLFDRSDCPQIVRICERNDSSGIFVKTVV
jgi:hypothetical protein